MVVLGCCLGLLMVVGGCWWLLVVFDGSWCFLLVLDFFSGSRWFMVVWEVFGVFFKVPGVFGGS